MIFDPTPAHTNEMIQFGSQTNYQDYSEYQAKMIQKFYPDADIDTIIQMNEWAKYPMLNIITIDALRNIECSILEKRFKITMANQIVSKNELNEFNTKIQHIKQQYEFGISSRYNPLCHAFHIDSDNNSSWTGMIMWINSPIRNEIHFGNGYFPASHLISHCIFVSICQSIWTAGQSTRVLNLSQIIIELQSEINMLKQKNADLSYQLQLNDYSLRLIQPINSVYDYQEIKSRKQKLHREFNRLSKLMKINQ